MRKQIEKIINDYAGVVAFTFILIGLGVIIFFLLSSPFNDWSFDRNPTLFSNYGDFIGGFVGTVFSLAGFFLIYKTLVTQQETLKQQDSVSRLDRFETTFFNLLQSQNAITNDIKAYFRSLNGVTNQVAHTVNGREFFIYSKRELTDIWNSLEQDTYLGYYDEEQAACDQNKINDLSDSQSLQYTHPDEAKEIQERIEYNQRLMQINKRYEITKDKWDTAKDKDIEVKLQLVYGLYFQRYHYVIGHYFRNLYHILDFIDASKVKQIQFCQDHENKEDVSRYFNKYASFVQAQMSSFELMLMFYNALSFPKSLELVKKYNFLENLTTEDLIDESHNCVPDIKLKSRSNLVA